MVIPNIVMQLKNVDIFETFVKFLTFFNCPWADDMLKMSQEIKTIVEFHDYILNLHG